MAAAAGIKEKSLTFTGDCGFGCQTLQTTFRSTSHSRNAINRPSISRTLDWKMPCHWKPSQGVLLSASKSKERQWTKTHVVAAVCR